MTDQTNAALVAEARRYVSDHDVYADNHLLRGLADALEAAEKRAEVAEQARDAVSAGYRAQVRKTAEAAHALMEVTEGRDALAAVVEKARALRPDIWDLGPQKAWPAYRDAVRAALDAVPADILRERDAEKWDEGFDAYEEDHLHHDAHGWGDEDCIDKTYNPYRSDERSRHE